MENGLIDAKLVVGMIFIAFLLGVSLTIWLMNWLDKHMKTGGKS